MPGITQEPEPRNGFEELVDSLIQQLGPSSGINSDDVDARELQTLMEEYQSEDCEWRQYAHKDKSRNYTRNLVHRGNGKCNLLILVWTPGQASPVHDHNNAHCIMKVLAGRLEETLYSWPTVQLNNGEPCAMKEMKKTVYHKNEVTYMSDKLGLHRVSNPDSDEFAVSVHLYTPANVAVYGCHMFDPETGKAKYIQQCGFYSEYGVKKREDSAHASPSP
ncbi:cysteine dioxygenase [Clohesyomyces aquaticus]|uniref:Cysteine dioxygenase n=1 Tax=Clohesyomyces aquaticus TaxID=1231657 RepID=A0A1Y1ZXF7_9PLEO|nr:cysteine dioxygenase [Clohesyomyces aquaticus]